MANKDTTTTFIETFNSKVKKHKNKTLERKDLDVFNTPEAYIWITELLKESSQKISYPIVPSQDQVNLYDFLCLEIGYKKTLKQAFDQDSILVNQLFNKCDMLILSQWKSSIKKINGDVLGIYLNFREDIDDAKSQDREPYAVIHEQIDKLSIDSKYGTVISHAAKFSHPLLTQPRIYVHLPRQNDGYLKTGNVKVDFDLHINATLLKVYKFLSLTINEKSIKDYRH